jgi:uncharacterized membrane protein
MTRQDPEAGIRRIITAGLLLAITLLLTLTRIGMIPVPTPAANATIAHIPAILGGILEGPLVGLIVGMGFGFGSFMSATTPLFKDPFVAVLPRLFIGVVSAYVYFALRKADRRTLTVMIAVLTVLLLGFSYQVGITTLWLGIVVAALAVAIAIALVWWLGREEAAIIGLAIAAAAGSLTNTVLVLTIATLRGYFAPSAAWAIGLTHGVPEVIVSAIVVVGVVSALRQIGSRQKGSRI